MWQGTGRTALIICLLSGMPSTLSAQERTELGQARLFTNDMIGDRRDRWRSGSYGVSTLRGAEWTGQLPLRMGEIMEYRFRGEVITPANIANPAAGDRLYAGVLSVGAHTHFGFAGFEASLGLDIVGMGDQTGIRSLQETVHDALSMPIPNVENFQVENGIYLHGTFELGREFDLGGTRLRPFVELQAGVETLARMGFDLTFGNYGLGGLRVRDVTTGHRISAIDSESDYGLSVLIGGDVAWVDSSRYLPADRGFVPEDTRYRLRAGMNYAVGFSNIFYGLTYLSEEFVGQPEGQTVGSLTVDLQF
ncbi:lipid A-modifier LpxR family protein [Nioella sp.]|uniref:lipid A-modifier LpxR family protein n=1 Tax=Nioella sp. TaxID=1912091 RepID=UPI0035160592